MTQQTRTSIFGWIKSNIGWISTLLLLSWQISNHTLVPVYIKASGVVDTVWSNNRQVHELQREFSTHLVDQHEVDSLQNHKIEDLKYMLAKQP